MMVDYVYQEKYTSKVKRLMKGDKFLIPSADVHEINYVDRYLGRIRWCFRLDVPP